MGTNTRQSSNTPILDLQAPLPKPHDDKVDWPQLVILVGAFVLVVPSDSYALLPAYFAMAFLTTSIHEFGHILSGWSMGFRFEAVAIGPIWIKRESGKLNLRPRSAITGGLTFMSLDRIWQVRRRLIVKVAGGPAASLLCGAAALAFTVVSRSRNEPALTVFLIFFGIFSLYMSLLSVQPTRAGRYASDGMLLRALLRSKRDATQLIATYALATIKCTCLVPPDYSERWRRLAYSQTPIQNRTSYADWLAYEAADDQQAAAQSLERCLAGSALLDTKARDALIAEAVAFTALRRNDAAKAQIWFSRLVFPDQLHPLTKLRTEIALLCVREQFEQASAELARVLVLIRQSPAGKLRERYESSWSTWHDQVQQRVAAQIA
jgi:Peptidase M50B-like